MRKRLCKAKPNASRAAILRRLAGVSAGLRQTRRGSFLVMVVGALALIAVITVVYVTIGRSDTQTSAAVVRFDERKDVPALMRDHIASTIADDVFDVVYLNARVPNPDNPQNTVPLFTREAWDYPSVAHEVTIPTAIASTTVELTTSGGSINADARFQFSPTGNYTGTDPWLASSEPTLLNFDGTALNNELDAFDYFRERLDWANISNVAPDGVFVNLFNLRGNFGASPEEMRGGQGGVAPTLYTDPPTTNGSRGDITDYAVTVEDPASLDARPAELSSRQQHAAFPMVDPQYDPGDGLHLPYQWADTDGDGIADARWFEMVEDRDPSDDLFRYVFPDDPDYRYFFAVRIVDLSARVNVNTATDQTLAPVEDDPFGMTPAAVDLRALLTQEHAYTDYRMDFDGSGSTLGFGIERHLNQDLSRYPAQLPDADPRNYLLYFDDEPSNTFNAYAVGEKAYDALRTYIDLGVTPQAGYVALENMAASTGLGVDREFADGLASDVINPYWGGRFAAQGYADFAPSDYYRLFGGYGLAGGLGDFADPDAPSGISHPFGLESLAELLTFDGVNDDRARSRLEAALSGRVQDGNPLSYPYNSRFSPLRDNRDTEYERTRHIIQNRNVLVLDEALASLQTDIRKRLTVVSGARPIRPEGIPGVQDGRYYVVEDADLVIDDEALKSEIDFFNATNDLYRFYAEALAPLSGLRVSGASVWDWAANNSLEPYMTLFYGNLGPHVAVRTAAHLAVNMRDAYDTDGTQTIRTVVLDADPAFRNNELDDNDRDPLYPWALLDLGTERLPDHQADTVPATLPRAVNIHGIDAQPFITEAAAFVMFTDTPNSLGGDDDTGDLGDGIPRDIPTINPLATDLGNRDFLFHALAIQLHNPFDSSIELSGTLVDGEAITAATRGLYYIQYGDTFFKLVDVSSGSETSVSLGAGETRTFYVLSQHENDVVDRILNVTGDSDYGGRTQQDERDRFDSWIDSQFGDSSVLVPTFDPTTGLSNIVSEGSTSPLDYQNGSDAERTIVKLWRVEKPHELADPNGGFLSSAVNEIPVNARSNDTLVDRMREPAGATTSPVLDLTTGSTSGLVEVNGADPGNEPPGSNNGDNQGLSLTRFGVIRRNADPNASLGDTTNSLRGMLPAYCIELKDESGSAANDEHRDGSAINRFDISDFTSGFAGADTLNQLLDQQVTSNPVEFLTTVGLEPWRKDSQSAGVQDIADNLASDPFEDLIPEPHIRNDNFQNGAGLSVMRVADVLLPLGIGAHQIPDYNGIDEELEWTTLSEALALALYYETPPVQNDAEGLYADLFNPFVVPEDVLLDRGQLQLFAFVPFFDDDADGIFDPVNNPDDARWGLGVPMAAALLDEFTMQERRFGGINTPTHGLININTVSRETARAIPGLSPTSALSNDNVTVNWWWDPAEHGNESDIATTLVAFRDRLSLHPKDFNGSQTPDETVNFRNPWDLGVLSDPFDDAQLPVGSMVTNYAPGSRLAEINGDNARQGATGVRALTEEPGFRSIGQLLLLDDRDFVSTNPAYEMPHSIVRLGFDNDTIDVEGVDSVTYDDGAGSRLEDTIADDYDEQLAIANAALGSTSIRSDYFVAWFVVHGYRESDVVNADGTNLQPHEPMIPSVARRFMMVVDRSKVVSPGDRPEILMFKEVPL